MLIAITPGSNYRIEVIERSDKTTSVQVATDDTAQPNYVPDDAVVTLVAEGVAPAKESDPIALRGCR